MIFFEKHTIKVAMRMVEEGLKPDFFGLLYFRLEY
jgi:hypothetical protein